MPFTVCQLYFNKTIEKKRITWSVWDFAFLTVFERHCSILTSDKPIPFLFLHDFQIFLSLSLLKGCSAHADLISSTAVYLWSLSLASAFYYPNKMAPSGVTDDNDNPHTCSSHMLVLFCILHTYINSWILITSQQDRYYYSFYSKVGKLRYGEVYQWAQVTELVHGEVQT